MHRFKRLFIVLILVGIVVIVGAVAAAILLPNTQLVRTTIQERLSAVSGHAVTLGALDVSFSLSGLVRMRLEGLSVRATDGKVLLSIQEADLSPAILPLLNRQIRIESVDIQGLQAYGERRPDGSLLHAFIPPMGAIVEPQPVDRPDATGTQKPSQPPSAPLIWSVNALKITNARVDWVDKALVPGEEIALTLRGINGSLDRQGNEENFGVKLQCELSLPPDLTVPLLIEGSTRLLPDMSGLKTLEVSASANPVPLKPVRRYVPDSAGFLNQFEEASLRTRLTWEAGTAAKIGVQSRFRSTPQDGVQLDVRADLVTERDTFEIADVKAAAESDSLPLSYVREYLGTGLPLDTSKGTLKASVEMDWKRGTPWQLRGNLGLDQGVPTGFLAKVTKNVKVWLQLQADPQRLVVENLEITGPYRLASLAGSIERPFEGNPVLNLKAEVPFESQWLPMSGVRLPKEFGLKGSVVLRGSIQGRVDSFNLDLSGDATPAGLDWQPFLEKKPGKRANLSVKASVVPDAKGRGPEVNAAVSLALHDAQVRIKETDQWTVGWNLLAQTKIQVLDGKPGLKDTMVRLRKDGDNQDVVLARVNVGHLGTDSQRLDGTAEVRADHALFALFAADPKSGIVLKGSVPIKIRFSGSPSALDLTAEAMLTNLDIAVDKQFKKPAGTPGDIKIEAKYAQEVLLNSGRLSLAGIAVTARPGVLMDRSGQFQGLALDVPEADLTKLARLIPNLTSLGLAGTASGKLRFVRSAQGIVPSATLQLASVSYRPQGAEWRLEKVNGAAELTNGNTVTIQETQGLVQGLIEGPLKVKGTLTDIGSQDTMQGRINLEMSNVRMKSDRWRAALGQATDVLAAVLSGQAGDGKTDALEFQSLKGDVDLKNGAASTENLRLKGNNLSAGAIGAMKLANQELDLLAGLRTLATVPASLGQVPIVRDVVGRNKELLKATGLDKELKRFGIEVPGSSGQPPQEAGKSVQSQLLVMLKIRGPAGSPKVTPVLENTLDKQIGARLKALLD